MKKVVFNLVILAGLLSFQSCSDDDEETSPFQGTDNTLVSFALTTTGGVRYVGEITDNQVVVTAPQNVSLSGATATYTLCEQASISPDPAQLSDWDNEHQFTVTSYNNTPKTYTYSVKRTDVASDGSVTLLTQSDVVALAESGIAIINGDLVIGDNNDTEEEDPITDLSPLAGLNEVKQNIFVYASFAGTGLNGLENITSAAGLYLGSTSLVLTTPNEFEVKLSSLKSLGSLVVNSGTIKSLLLPALKETGYLYICAQKLEKIDFTSLTDCSTDFIMKQSSTSTYNEVLEALNFPALENVGGLLTLNNFAAQEVTFPKLKQIGAAVNIRYMKGWKDISFPELTAIYSTLTMQNMTMVNSLLFPKLETINGAVVMEVYTYSTNTLSSVNFDSLKSVEGKFTFHPCFDATITELNFPSLVRVNGQFYIYQSQASGGMTESSITSVTFPKLSDCSDIYLYGLNSVEEIDASGCTSLDILNLVSLYKLSSFKSGNSVLTTLTLNSGSKVVPETVVITGVEEVTGTLSITNNYNEYFTLDGSIKKVGTLKANSETRMLNVSIPNIEEVGTLNMSSNYTWLSFKMKNLKTITTQLNFGNMRDMPDDGLDFPSLTKVETLTISGYQTAILTSLKGFSALEEVGSVSITNMANLVDFSALATAAEKMTSGWTVSGNAYNPTLDDMHAGKYVQE